MLANIKETGNRSRLQIRQTTIGCSHFFSGFGCGMAVYFLHRLVYSESLLTPLVVAPNKGEEKQKDK